ncbi:MAG: Flp pilus assembly complex ATPase component TadA [Butyrivibrio sp.]|uniref:ATPase, T2SS/T4P/T4SS family n=1 Tax=Butyrivibrio sp. TaxID=28121 RepID=UPI001B3CC917|nr:ATPase, T2SS/T4P/T4SS family [Butyrivibrio sp.]MBP3784555.1 Flp pilus assembly complex ATPase component TadA [Butyrivibrio sp.]
MDTTFMAPEKKLNISILRVTNREALETIQKGRKTGNDVYEHYPWAIDTPFTEIAENIIRDKKGPWATPLYYTTTYHKPNIGVREVCLSAEEYIRTLPNSENIEIMSLCSYIEDGKIVLRSLVRSYGAPFSFTGFFSYIHDDLIVDVEEEEPTFTGKLLIPEEAKNFEHTEEEIRKNKEAYERQKKVYETCTEDKPFLNCIEEYAPSKLPTVEDKMDLIYDLKTSDQRIKTKASYEDFNKVFVEMMTFVNGVEFYTYAQIMKGEKSEDDFMAYLETHLQQNYVNKQLLPAEDVPAMLKKLYRSLFKLYVIQDLIDDPNVTDIKITAPDSIRTRIKGKAYITNISFIDLNDYLRFVNGLCIKNNILQDVPEQTFTDTHDENYILRFTLSAQYISSRPWPDLHIRKIDRNKPLGDDLIRLGMMPPKVRDYLVDIGKTSRGVIFAGPPGSGKTVCLNFFLEEAYEQSAEILVIQENDELFAYRKGVMFQHPVKYSLDKQPINLAELGELALVAGANVFVIGEAKGPEICSAITLSNSGCRTAMTIHSFSATGVVDKMVDLAMKGDYKNPIQAKKNIQSFQTMVYLEDFKIKEIAEITGYNEETNDMEYKYIYKYEEEA